MKAKTLLKRFVPEVAEKIKNNIIKQRGELFFKTGDFNLENAFFDYPNIESYFLRGSMIWDDSLEGYDYWENIFNNINDYLIKQ